jgi:hypothetical protein
MTDEVDTRDLAAFANAGGQPNQPERPPPGHALTRQTSAIGDELIGAQPVAVHRDEQRIFPRLAALAAAAGEDWFYRFPVKKKDGGQDWIEGPSIKLANEVLRIFGNLRQQVREFDVGGAWVFYARVHDLEGGSSMERAYRQRKSQASMRTRDADRQLDIAYQIGQSKAIRNVICNFLQIYADYAFEEARNSLVNKIGKDLDGWRKRTLASLAKMPVDLARVERVVGRAAKDWLAPNIAQVIAMGKSIADGMASVDEVFPLIESSSSATISPDNAVETSGGEQERSQQEVATAVNPHEMSSELPPNPHHPAAVDDLVKAYERGKQAKAAGDPRKAMPTEYHNSTHTRHALCWTAGFDDKPLPTFERSST